MAKALSMPGFKIESYHIERTLISVSNEEETKWLKMEVPPLLISEGDFIREDSEFYLAGE